jgi:hypothetical protein
MLVHMSKYQSGISLEQMLSRYTTASHMDIPNVYADVTTA